MKNNPPQVLLIHNHDGLATSERAFFLKKYLRKDFQVKVLNTNNLNEEKFFETLENKKRKLFFIKPRILREFIFDIIGLNVEKKIYQFLKETTREKLSPTSLSHDKNNFIQSMIIRALLIQKSQRYKNSDIIICLHSHDALSLLTNKDKITMFDCPTPYSAELRYEKPNRLNQQQLEVLKTLDKIITTNISVMSFNWDSYRDFFEKEYSLTLKNYFSCPTGIMSVQKKAHFAQNPKIIFVGNLDGYWINPSLLISLVKKSKYQIDIYGKTVNKKILALPNYKGYLFQKDHHKLSEYQYGLITLTKDPLRKNGFSAKSMLYLSYGLVLLVPNWRKDPILSSASLHYNQQNFNQVISNENKTKWSKKQKLAQSLVHQYTWYNSMTKLSAHLKKLIHEK